MTNKLVAVGMVVICTLLIAYASVIWKFIADLAFAEILMSWQLWIGFIMLGFGAALLITAFKYGDVTALFPIIATNYIWITFLSHYYFNEPLTVFKWISITGIVLGITILGKGKGVEVKV